MNRLVAAGLVLVWVAVCSSTPPPAPYDQDYAAFHRRVTDGSPGVLYVGVKARPTYDDCWLPSGSFGWPDGAYKCWSENGTLKMDGHVAVSAPARSVPAAKTFRGPARDPDHTCNRCGRTVTVIAGWNRDGTHDHQCSCGNRWRH